MKRSTWSKFAVLALCSCVSVIACDDDDSSNPGSSGSGNDAGTGADGGDGPSKGGSNNNAGKGGTAGTAGTAGSSPNAGEGGSSNGGAPVGPGGDNAGGSGAEGGAPLGGAGGADGSGGEGGAVGCFVPASFGNLGATTGTAEDSGDSLIYTTELPDVGQFSDVLRVEMYPDIGVFDGSFVEPGVYEIKGDELNYATCGLCVLYYDHSDGTKGGSRGVYMATGGTVTITEVDPKLVGTLTNVTFEHVTIAPAPDYTSTPVGDDCNTVITNATFDQTVE